VETSGVQPTNQFIGATIVRVQLGELSHQIVRNAIGLHAGRDENAANAKSLMAIRVKACELLVVEKLAESGRDDDVEL